MPSSILTLHAYQSWMPDHDRGYVRDGQIHPPDIEQAYRYRRQAGNDGVVFDADQLQLMHSGALDIARRRDWIVHAVFGESTHLHIVFDWHGTTVDRVKQLVPNLLSKFLGQQAGVTGKRWFGRRPSFRPVRDEAHREYLIGDYQRKHGMLRWRAGDPEPPSLGELLA